MFSKLLRGLILAGSLLLLPTAQASAPPPLHEKADTLGLAEDPYWLLLLRYESAHTASGWMSDALSASFFLSNEGRVNPRQELHALLDQLHAEAVAGSDAIPCRFPARSAWLRTRLGLPSSGAACPLLTEWKKAINPAQATLVFASDYLNSPSSMFGHTFLRLDAAEQTEDTRLLAYAVNYAANAGDSNPLSFAWKGLTGGYPGVFSLMPYYDKVKEYSDLENRDLWEYQLTFTPAELDRLLDHLWELRNIEFPYYFLTRNCSYQLLSLMEVARPGLHLRDAFPLQAIPTDTVRRVVQEPSLMRKLVYRPAAERRLLQDARDNDGVVNRTARALARQPDLATGLPPEQEAAALETAYDYLYYLFMSSGPDTQTRSNLRQLLVRRSANPAPGQRATPEAPGTDPANGHPTARLALGAGQARDAGYLTLRLRPAYHDLLDSPAGYRHGAHIDFLDMEVRVDEERQSLRLERLALVDIDSLASWDVFFRPWSWFFGAGYRQAAIDSQGRFSSTTSHGVTYAEGGAGATLNLAEGLDCYGLVALTTEAGAELEKGGRAGAGPRLGCLLNLGQVRVKLQGDSRYLTDLEKPEHRALLETQLDLKGQNALRLQLGHLEAGRQQRGFGEASWIHYF
ncbi:MAG: hypothetical protein K0S46_714 [Moraxellaceae bacterium]|jgi:hypothetical protein|nr:hypothetical protein [Moraxellaceae bacterium]